jgi:hypothetical protein
MFESDQSDDSRGHSDDDSVYGIENQAPGQSTSLDIEYISVSPNFVRDGPALRQG